MRVARLSAAGVLRLFDEPPPVPGPGESLVRVGAVGLCGSDLHWWQEGSIGDAQLTRPLVLGHELAGVVIGGARDGERVAVDPARPCWTCPTCLTGHRHLCPQMRFAGHGDTDGGLRELLTWPDQNLHTLAADLSLTGGALLEPLGVAVHAMDLAHVRLAATVVVVGAGPIGLLLVQLARAAGATTVVSIEPLAHRRAAASAAGATAVLDPTAADARATHAALEADAVLEVVGGEDAVATAVTAARPGGRVVLVGIPDDDRTTFQAAAARRKGLTIAVSRRMGDVYPRAMSLVQRGMVDLRRVVSDHFPLAHVENAFAVAARRTGLKVVIDVSADLAGL